VSLICCSCVEREKACPDTAALVWVVRGSVPGGGNREGLSTVAGCAGGLTRSSCEALAGRGGRGAKGLSPGIPGEDVGAAGRRWR
jgi:hypothetical protein